MRKNSLPVYYVTPPATGLRQSRMKKQVKHPKLLSANPQIKMNTPSKIVWN